MSHHFSLAFMKKDIKKRSAWTSLLPGSFKTQSIEDKSFRLAVIGTESYSRSERLKQLVCPWFDDAHQRREDFKTEMRVLARLRHPCITTGKQHRILDACSLSLCHELISKPWPYSLGLDSSDGCCCDKQI